MSIKKCAIRSHYLILMLCSIVSPLSLFAPAANAESLSFSEAWQAVLERNDSLAAQRANLSRTEHMQDAAKSRYLPDISVGANYTRLDRDVELKPSQLTSHMNGGDQISNLIHQLGNIGGLGNLNLDHALTTNLAERDVFTSSIRAVWPIFTGGRISAANAIAGAQKNEAKHLMAMEQQAKFEDLAKVYFATVLAEQVVATRYEAELGLKKHLDHARKLEQQGQIAKVERLQAEVSHDKAQTERKKAQRDLDIAKAALKTLVKSDAPVSPESGLFMLTDLPPMSPIITKTLTAYPGLKVLDAKHEQASGMINVEKGKYYPEVYLYGNYSLHEGESLTAELAPDWAVGIGVKVPLIDSSGRSDRVKAAHSTVLQVNYLRAQAEQDLTLLVEKTWREADQAIEEYQGLESSVALAKENLRLREKAFAQGMSTSLEVVDAELYLAGTKTQQLAAAYQYVISLSRLLAVSGEMDSFSTYQHQASSIEVQS